MSTQNACEIGAKVLLVTNNVISKAAHHWLDQIEIDQKTKCLTLRNAKLVDI